MQNNQPIKPNVNPDNTEQLRQLKHFLAVSTVLIVVLTIMLGYNLAEIRNFETIQSGEYYTEEQCISMFSNSPSIPINVVDSSNGSNITISFNGVE